MCRVDECDGRVEVLQSKDRKARKEHGCGECGRVIVIGETYHYEFGTMEGHADAYVTCAHCMTGRGWLQKNCGGFVYEQTVDELNEHAQDYPALRLPLYRVVVGAKRQWQRFGGGLMNMPKMPPPIEIHE